MPGLTIHVPPTRHSQLRETAKAVARLAALVAVLPVLACFRLSALLVGRNRAWVPRIEAMLGEPGAAFVLVGDLHLVGEASVPACLAAAGLPAVRLR